MGVVHVVRILALVEPSLAAKLMQYVFLYPMKNDAYVDNRILEVVRDNYFQPFRGDGIN